jgi:hypothetical protein
MPKVLSDQEKKERAWRNEGLTLVFKCKNVAKNIFSLTYHTQLK